MTWELELELKRRAIMNINKYTEKAQEAVLAAQQLADARATRRSSPEHLLVTLVEQREGIVPRSSGR